jgi:hypothetical protein
MRTTFTQKTIDLIIKELPDQRMIFKKEYSHALKNYHDFMIELGYRFYDNDRVIRSLESNHTEEVLLKEFNNLIQKTLMSLASADYYYSYEKQWD